MGKRKGNQTDVGASGLEVGYIQVIDMTDVEASWWILGRGYGQLLNVHSLTSTHYLVISLCTAGGCEAYGGKEPR